MAEAVGLSASLVGIASFGVSLTTTLSKFGSTASCAREQTDYVARHVSLYSDVLELLAQRIDNDEPIHSRKALDLVYDIHDQSCDLFDKIEDLLPDRADRMSFMERIKWNFKKTKVDLLVAEIEYLKSTANLLVSVLYAGRKIRTHRKGRSKKAEEEAKVQFAKAQIAILEQVNATAVKENCEAKAEEDDQTAADETIGITGQRKTVDLFKHPPHVTQLVNNTAMVQFRQLVGQARNPLEERSLVISNSVDLLNALLDQWTNLADDSTAAATTDVGETLTTRATNLQSQKESNNAASAASSAAEEARDIWRNRFIKSQERVKQLEAHVIEMKTTWEQSRGPLASWPAINAMGFKALAESSENNFTEAEVRGIEAALSTIADAGVPRANTVSDRGTTANAWGIASSAFSTAEAAGPSNTTQEAGVLEDPGVFSVPKHAKVPPEAIAYIADSTRRAEPR